MKIGIYVCSNGYGHFHRMLQVCTHLPFHDFDFYCEKYQYNRFKPNQDNINFIFYDEPNIRWDNTSVGSLVVNDIDKYDNYKDYFTILDLKKNDMGLAFSRDFCKTYADNNNSKWYWLIDDDITKFYKTLNNKNVPITPKEALESAQEQFSVMPIALGSLEYQQYSWSQKKPFKLNSYADCVVCFNVERTKKYKYDLQFKLKQDRDMALQIMSDNQYVMRALKISFSCPSYGSNKGGLHEVYHKQKLEKTMAERLVKKWGKKYVNIQVKEHS